MVAPSTSSFVPVDPVKEFQNDLDAFVLAQQETLDPAEADESRRQRLSLRQRAVVLELDFIQQFKDSEARLGVVKK